MCLQEDSDSLDSAVDAILFDGTDSWQPEHTSPPAPTAAVTSSVTSSMMSSPRDVCVNTDRTSPAHMSAKYSLLFVYLHTLIIIIIIIIQYLYCAMKSKDTEVLGA